MSLHKSDTYFFLNSAPVVLGSDCKCGILAHCDHGHLVEYFNISSPVDCLHECHIDAEYNCNWVTYNVETGACFLFHQCSYGLLAIPMVSNVKDPIDNIENFT